MQTEEVPNKGLTFNTKSKRISGKRARLSMPMTHWPFSSKWEMRLFHRNNGSLSARTNMSMKWLGVKCCKSQYQCCPDTSNSSQTYKTKLSTMTTVYPPSIPKVLKHHSFDLRRGSKPPRIIYCFAVQVAGSALVTVSNLAFPALYTYSFFDKKQVNELL